MTLAQEIRPHFIQGLGLTLGAMLVLGVIALIGGIIHSIGIKRYKPEDLITPFSLYLQQLLANEKYKAVADCEKVLEALKRGYLHPMVSTYQLKYIGLSKEEKIAKTVVEAQRRYDNDKYLPTTEQEEIKWVVLGRKAGHRYK